MKKTQKKEIKAAAKAASKKAKPVRAKRQVRQLITNGCVYVQSSFNNTIVTLTDERGQVLDWLSAGSIGYKGAKKSTPYAATIVAKRMVEKIERLGLRSLVIKVKGVGSGRESAVRAFQGGNFEVASISDVTPIPHNGCRPKRPRRV